MRTRPRSVGYYVHHAGSGHRHRATALARRLAGRGVEVTGLSSSERPAGWPGGDEAWLVLDRDDVPAPAHDPDHSFDVTAAGRLHWVPTGHPGLSRRTAQLSAWLDEVRPGLVVSDVSQEVTLLARLHGVRVVSVLLPGHRDDPAHALGLGVSEEVVGFWPLHATGMSTGLPADVAGRMRALGGQSRFDPVPGPRPARPRHLVVLAGTGGGAERLVAAGEDAVRGLEGWTCEVLGGGAWVTDPFERLRAAAVVLTHAGQNALAEVAAAQVPAVVVPLDRPFDEQRTTAGVLAAGAWPAVVVDDRCTDAPDSADAVRRAADLDGTAWQSWVDGTAADRFADLVCSVLDHAEVPA